MTKDYISQYLRETREITDKISKEEIEKGIEILQRVKDKGGRLFLLGMPPMLLTIFEKLEELKPMPLQIMFQSSLPEQMMRGGKQHLQNG